LLGAGHQAIERFLPRRTSPNAVEQVEASAKLGIAVEAVRVGDSRLQPQVSPETLLNPRQSRIDLSLAEVNLQAWSSDGRPAHNAAAHAAALNVESRPIVASGQPQLPPPACQSPGVMLVMMYSITSPLDVALELMARLAGTL
jgi:hypothetical protein